MTAPNPAPTSGRLIARIVIAVLILTVPVILRQYSARPSPEPESTRPTPLAGPPASMSRSGPMGPMVEPRDLSIDESRGGHTLARHVGRTDAQLRERLRQEPDISAASTYLDRRAAERTAARALAEKPSLVTAWLNRDGPRPNFTVVYHGRDVIGRSLRRGASEVEPATDAIVVLRWIAGKDYYVLTSYPEARR